MQKSNFFTILFAILCAFLTSGLLTRPATAQNSSLRFVHLTTADGLVHDIVRSIVQDHRGFMWFGTQGGLNRYDGKNFSAFHHLRSQSDSLSNDTVNVLYEDSQGDLWIGTVTGLDRLALNRSSFVHFSEIYESVQTILEDAHSNLWIGTAGSGLFKYERTTGKFQQFLPDPSNENSLSDSHITALAEDHDGLLWIGSEYGGLNLYDPLRDRFSAFHHSSSDPFSLPNERVTSILIDPNGSLWVGSGSIQDENQGGLVQYDPQRKCFYP
ncbi:MAG: ligand-binding sensor domain-containing protein, partial [Anaerolineales bacterium]